MKRSGRHCGTQLHAMAHVLRIGNGSSQFNASLIWFLFRALVRYDLGEYECLPNQVAGGSSQRHATLPTYYEVVLRTEKVLLCTTKYYSSTTLYYKVLIHYYSVLQSTNPLLLCTTKYYSSTTKYYSSTSLYYKVLLQY